MQKMADRFFNQIYPEWTTTLSLHFIAVTRWKPQPKNTKPNIEIIQLSKLMGEALLRLTPITLQQEVSWGPIWDPIKNPTFWYHEGMLLSTIIPETNLSQI
jgi:hypothetical protein